MDFFLSLFLVFSISFKNFLVEHPWLNSFSLHQQSIRQSRLLDFWNIPNLTWNHLHCCHPILSHQSFLDNALPSHVTYLYKPYFTLPFIFCPQSEYPLKYHKMTWVKLRYFSKNSNSSLVNFISYKILLNLEPAYLTNPLFVPAFLMFLKNMLILLTRFLFQPFWCSSRTCFYD